LDNNKFTVLYRLLFLWSNRQIAHKQNIERLSKQLYWNIICFNIDNVYIRIFNVNNFLIFCCLNQENEEIEESNNLLKQSDSIIVDNNNNDDRKYFDWKIPLISFFDICSFIPLVFGNEKHLFNLSLSAILLILTTIFTRYYLNYSIYKHHIIGINCVVIGVLIHDIFNFFPNDKFPLLYFIFILLQIPNSWKEIFEKDIIENNFFNIYLLLFYEGIFGCLFTSLFIVIYPDLRQINEIYSKIKDYIYWIISFIFSCGFFNIFRLKINQVYGPIHRCIGNTFIFLIVWVIDVFIQNEKENNLLIIICYIFIIFGASIFIEIISFNCCCGSDIQKNKIERANEKFRNNIFIEEE